MLKDFAGRCKTSFNPWKKFVICCCDEFSSGAADEAMPTDESKQTNFSQENISKLKLVCTSSSKIFQRNCKDKCYSELKKEELL